MAAQDVASAAQSLVGNGRAMPRKEGVRETSAPAEEENEPTPEDNRPVSPLSKIADFLSDYH